MGDVETEHPDHNQLSSRQKETKCVEKFANVKFPITIEPLVCLYTISVGLNEVIIWIYTHTGRVQGVLKKLGLVFNVHQTSKSGREEATLKMQFYQLGGVFKIVEREGL